MKRVLLLFLFAAAAGAQGVYGPGVSHTTVNPAGVACGSGSQPIQFDPYGQIFGCRNGVETLMTKGNLTATGIPVILAPNGTVATNGVVTLGTALPGTFPEVWLRLPAGAVSGGSAGVYYATCSNTTTCQVKTNFVDPSTTAFAPFVPSSTANATGSNAAYTQTTAADVILIRTAIAAGALGANGYVEKTTYFINNNSAGSKVAKVGFNGGLQVTVTQTTNPSARAQLIFQNMGDAGHQSVFPSFISVSTTGTALSIGTTDTTAASAIVATCSIATATDWCGVVQNRDELNYLP